MRRHSARVLNVDEVDACLATAEGDAVSLATQRTLTWPNRKIVCGGTPLDIETSTIARLYSESDQRIWTVPCPRCSEFHEIQWEAISWPEGHPEQAAWTCPSCGAVVEEKKKAAMIRRGRWHIQNPEATPRHVGFKINALSSSLPNAAWGKLAAEYERAKNDPALLKVFHNTALGIPWAEEGDHIDENALATRAEKFSLDAIPPEVLALSCGVDAQDDRLEPVICGWARDGTCFVLHHEPIWGDINDTLTWRQLEDLLRTRWPHPLGGFLKIDACCIDGGDGGHMEHVMAFCRPRTARRVLCVKGVAGFSRLPLIASKSKMRGGGRLWLAGVDSIKAQLFSRLQRGSSMRFSDTLAPEFYEQLGSERRVIRTVGGKPVVRFERIKGMRAEALDGLTYPVAARAALMLNEAVFNRREDELRSPPRPRAAPATEAPESPLAPEPSFLSTKHSLWQGKGGNPWLGPGRRSWWDRED